MKHIWLILLALLLVACGSATDGADSAETIAEQVLETPGEALDDEPTPLPTEAPAPTAAPTVVAAEEADVVDKTDAEAEEVAASESDGENTADAGDAVPESVPPLRSPQEANITRDNDRYKGAEDPDVVLIEYGDFQ